MTALDLAAAIRELDSPWMNDDGAAAYLRISVRRFRTAAAQPGFPRYGRNGKWDRSRLDAWMEGMPFGTVTRHPLYNTWKKMRDRCENRAAVQFRWYGARGITVCERWKSFRHFVNDVGERPSVKHTLDRIDNDRGYAPDNCRWATRAEQYANRSTPRELWAVVALESVG